MKNGKNNKFNEKKSVNEESWGDRSLAPLQFHAITIHIV